MNTEAFAPILVQITLAVIIAAVIISASRFFGQRARFSKIKDTAYECGMVAPSKPHPRFSVKFYLTAMLFILFDIEVVFLIPWVVVYKDLLAANYFQVLPLALFFLATLFLGLFYEMRKGALDWER